MVRMIDYKKNPNIGVVAVANDYIAIVPQDSPKEFVESIAEELKVDVLRTNICGTSVIGALVALNNNGILVNNHIYESELKILKENDINVGVVEDKLNALGNLILANDKGAVVSKGFKKTSLKKIEEVLNCEVVEMEIENYRTVGSLGIANNQGAVLHPMLSESVLEEIEDVLKVNVDVGTVNRGVGFVKTGAIANNKGIVVGTLTTGVEITRLEDVLGFL